MKCQQSDNKVRYLSYMEAEREAVALYEALARAEQDPRRAQIFRQLVESEERHVFHWAENLGIRVDDLPSYRPGLRVRFLGWLARHFGTQRVLSIVLRIEGRDTAMYKGEPGVHGIVADEEGHSHTLRGLKEGRYPGSELSEGGWKRMVGGGLAFRAAVLGGNDGLVSIFALVWGVAGGTSDTNIIMLAGIAGLVAGAFSMAAGEYVSMRAHRDLAEHRLKQERHALERFPEEEREELSLIYQLKGLTKEEAEVLAERIMGDPEIALDTMAREELGLDPGQLGSPWKATGFSFAAFTVGGVIPVIPYLFSGSVTAFSLSGGLSAAALLFVGMLLASMSGVNPLRGGIRMLAIGMTAALVTFGIGRLIGLSLA